MVGLALGLLRDPLDVALGLPPGRRELGALGPLRLELAEALLELGQAPLDLLVPLGLDLALLLLDLPLDLGEVLVAALLVDPGDDVGREVDDPLQVLGRDVQEVAEARRDALEVPDVGHRGGQLDVAHPLPAHLGAGDLHPAPLADDALEPDPLVLPAVALPVPGRPEDPLAEQAVLLGLQGPVVDGLRLLDLAVGPGTDLVRGGQADAELIEVVHVQHERLASSTRTRSSSVTSPAVTRSPRSPAPAARGRSRAPRPRGTRPRRSRGARSPRRPPSGPRRSGRATASP